MTGPPKNRKPLTARKGLRKLRWHGAHWISGVLLLIFHDPCWAILEWRARLEDERCANARLRKWRMRAKNGQAR